MLEQAQAEGHRANVMFGYAVKAEAVHAELYKRALEAAAQGADLTEAKFYLCPFCGHIEFGNPPDTCPICGALRCRRGDPPAKAQVLEARASPFSATMKAGLGVELQDTARELPYRGER